MDEVIQQLKIMLDELPRRAEWGEINYGDLEPRQQALRAAIKVLKKESRWAI